MLRDEYLRRLVDEAFVDLYLSANDGHRIYWPWRMQPPAESSRAYRNACEMYIIDSEPQSPHIGNRDVLDEAVRVDADMVLLADYFPFDLYDEILDPEEDPEEWEAYEAAQRQFGDAYSASIHSVRDGLDLAESHPFDGEIIVPLQAPHADAVKELPSHDRYAIGGLKDSAASDYRRVEAARCVRNEAPRAWLHGLGWGATDAVVAAVHENPDLLDSVDYSTPMQTAIAGVDAGAERMSVQAAKAGAQLIEDLRRFSPHLTDSPEPPKTEQRTLLADGGV
ncbi:hypothetical protein [Haloparvum sedimenti]|uniref:hypothetical protein n=1 Tax=Haloparvum sedimenti TaxID=1678448 RepID=UPI00071E7AA1|nr:hypothetical protein [Haloparvum sedimenti]